MSLRKLAGETAIYGIPTIVGRLLYFALTPYYTRLFPTDEYGIVTDLFALIGFAMVLFTYRMELAYFRFGTDNKTDKNRAFDSAMTSIIVSTLVLGSLFALLSPWIADISSYPGRTNLIYMAVGILSLDALCEIPYARLRLDGRAKRFAFIRMINIVVNLGGNLFFLLLCPLVLADENLASLHPLIQAIYDPGFGIGYIFLANLLASAVALLMLSPEFLKMHVQVDMKLWKRMITYAFPLVIVGFSYVVNEMFDRKVMIWWLPGTIEENQSTLGIYGANYKLAMILTLLTQAFRYGAEPFFFRQMGAKDSLKSYAEVTKYFAILGIAAFLFVMLYIDIFKYFIGEEYWSGLDVVPVLLIANLFLGLYYNFSVWYKITDHTKWGAYISVAGAIITILLNWWLIPVLGYMGAAWTTLCCYAFMMIACWYTGLRFVKIPYQLGRMLIYLGTGLGLFLVSLFVRESYSPGLTIVLPVNTILLLVFAGVIVALEKPFSRSRKV